MSDIDFTQMHKGWKIIKQSGLDYKTCCFDHYNSLIYVCGDFTFVNGNAWNRIATFDILTNTWMNPFGTGLNDTCNALCMIGTTLYAGGSFTSVNGNSWNYIAAFDTRIHMWFNPFDEDEGIRYSCKALHPDEKYNDHIVIDCGFEYLLGRRVKLIPFLNK